LHHHQQQQQAFNLEAKRTQWDTNVAAITTARDESVSSRKKLAETTKGCTMNHTYAHRKCRY
jgi:hypothetical protein